MGDIEGTYISNYFLPQDGDIGAGTYIEELFKLPSHLALTLASSLRSSSGGHASSSLGSSSKGSSMKRKSAVVGGGGSMDSATAASLGSSLGRDSAITKQLNMFLRTKSESGKALTESVS